MFIRMRYAQQALTELKKLDPNTNITKNYIRTLAVQGVIPSVMVGNRRLINFDALLEYLGESTQ